MTDKLILGITGTLSAGKDTMADYLEKKGFTHYSLSAELRRIMTKQGLGISIPELTAYGNNLRKEHGDGYLVKEISNKLIGDVIVRSIRQPGEAEALKSLGNFYLIFLDADIEERFRRLQKRNRGDDVGTLEEFKAIEDKQKTGKAKGAMNLEACRDMSDFQINNQGTFDELYQQIEDILAKIKNES